MSTWKTSIPFSPTLKFKITSLKHVPLPNWTLVIEALKHITISGLSNGQTFTATFVSQSQIYLIRRLIQDTLINLTEKFLIYLINRLGKLLNVITWIVFSRFTK